MSSLWRTIFSQIKEDLKPTAERIDLSWRIALICAVMVAVAMIYEIPFVAVSLFVIFYVMRSDSAESNVLAIALIILASVVVLLLLAIIQLTLPSPAMRLGVLLVTSYFLLFFGVSTQLGPLGGIIALVITFVLSILNYVEVPEIATRGTLYAWLMAATPMAIVILANWFWGRRPKNVLLFELKERLLSCESLLLGQVHISAFRTLVGEGMEAQQKRIGWLKAFRLAPKHQIGWAEHGTLNIYRFMLALLAWERSGAMHEPKAKALNEWLAAACHQAATFIAQGKAAQFEPGLELDAGQERLLASLGARKQAFQEMVLALHALSKTDDFSKLSPEKTPFAQPDIWRNPVYKHHAIKGTAAATICYMFYSIVDWQGIHTAMITCYVASLGTTADTLHKLTLRIIGCLIGAALGVLTLLFLMVHLNDVGSVLVVVFLVSLLSAWVFTGPERVSYAGIQIAFAFYLVLLHQYGPSFDFNAAWDRIVGVLVGNMMMYVFFTRLWPVGMQPSVESDLKQAQQLLKKLQQLPFSDRDGRVQTAAAVAVKLDAAHTAMQMMLFELRTIRPSPEVKRQLDRQLADLRDAFERHSFVF